MIHDEFISQCAPDMRLLYLLVHHGVHDADAAIDTERQSHFLVHTIKVWRPNFVNKLTYSNDSGLFADREAENGSKENRKKLGLLKNRPELFWRRFK